ncbi:SAM-dependent methyltransferase [Actinomadura opuntiae]|uniref:SAM-dependent methyltransferase n=1 Tax=Actinomadura sp. OS1-43 TaxID=604315 RepID=UPI00255A9245|nr:SAM-dependent methyltransferase [Actinomadura sp. OS1-43]MDL4818449.1 SAM-dependent methyltransferase [Actinomadura sp. OS1-43]
MSSEWTTAGMDVSRPSPARIYDWLLGGKDNFASDREAGTRLLEAQPLAGMMARANRGFLERGVRALAGAGVRRFLDLGTGLPTSPNVHEIALAADPDAQVVYVDNDPVVAAHNDALRAKPAGVAAIRADMRDADAVLARPEVAALFGPGEPVAVLMLAVLHFIPDEDDPHAVVAAYRDRLPSGGHLAVSTPSTDGYTDAELAEITSPYGNATAGVTIRTREAIEAFFGGWPLLPPGLVEASRWRTGGPELRGKMLAGIARKP